MLSNPNVNDLMEKSGNRYETVIALAKRARQIERRRIEKNDPCIKDSVDQAAQEIYDQKSFVKMNDEYICPLKDVEVDMNDVISETVDGILKNLALDSNDEVLSKISKEVNEEKEVKPVKEKKSTKTVSDKKTKASKK